MKHILTILVTLAVTFFSNTASAQNSDLLARAKELSAATLPNGQKVIPGKPGEALEIAISVLETRGKREKEQIDAVVRSLEGTARLASNNTGNIRDGKGDAATLQDLATFLKGGHASSSSASAATPPPAKPASAAPAATPKLKAKKLQ